MPLLSWRQKRLAALHREGTPPPSIFAHDTFCETFFRFPSQRLRRARGALSEQLVTKFCRVPDVDQRLNFPIFRAREK